MMQAYDVRALARVMLVGGLAARGIVPSGSLAAQTVRVRPVEKADSTQRVVSITIDGDMLVRKIRQLVASHELEQSIAVALREAMSGERSDSRKVRLLSDSVREIARRNAEMFSDIRVRCEGQRGRPEGYLGVTFETSVLTQRDGEPMMYELGAVESVAPGSPADKAGIKRGDVLQSVGGLDARKPIALANVLKAGARVPVRLQRGRASVDVTVLVEKRPQEFGSDCVGVDQLMTFEREAPTFMIRRDPGRAPTAGPGGMSSPRSVVPVEPPLMPMPGGGGFAYGFSTSTTIAGAQMMTLDDDGRQSLGVDNGVFVIKVLPGTPARDAGLRGLDVIVSADGEAVGSLGALRRIISNAQSQSVQLQLVRGGKTQTITLKWRERER